MTETTDPQPAIEVWARMLCAADVHVSGGDHPTWHQLSVATGRSQDDYRKAARWLLPRLTVTAPAVAPVPPSVPADRAAILREAADICDEAGAMYASKALNDHADGAFTLMERFLRKANEADFVATPCDFVACEPGGEPCSTHERLMAHAEGEHELCGPDCGTSPSRVADEAQPGLTVGDVARMLAGADAIAGRAQLPFDRLPAGEQERHRQTARTLMNRAEAQQDGTEAPFVTRVLELFSLSHADLYDGALFWRVDDGTVHLSANVSDVFAWGGADAEPITPDTLPLLEQAYTDLKSIDAELYLPELYVARQRGERPQGAAYPDDKTRSWREVSALFDACGPVRELGLGNPKAAPAHATQPAAVSQPDGKA